VKSEKEEEKHSLKLRERGYKPLNLMNLTKKCHLFKALIGTQKMLDRLISNLIVLQINSCSCSEIS